ncbi:ABC transporter, membrane spanning protein [Rhodovulum sp. P5]|uniref:carbohydrate ABC transporter permease n=1 Tax=Rhodovulum sp. P5 TaxID=1564506 RepID=UPI0009C3AF41|nr:carbohydrate ABC transporter permease [Rhodovulum sp. P5]ARE40341.1 ABC transporter, membrane spanning protein [Rhodovulum sp. P5]
MTAVDWEGLARSGQRDRRLRQGALIVFLTAVSIPIILPYFWMVMIAFTARTGGADSATLWTACAILVPVTLGYAAAYQALSGKARAGAGLAAIAVAVVLLWVFLRDDLHLYNFRFLITPNVVEDLRGAATAGGQFPWVWDALINSLILASSQTVIVVTVSTLAGYYLSRFAFAGRAAFLQSLLVLQAFPAITLVIPIFLMVYWIGLLNTLVAPILVLTALELPFFIFIMKGFFDAVPWDIEMSALTDGASRRQAFRMVVLPQVRVGMIAVGVFSFIKGWEEYVFVTGLRTGNSYWVMSTYLYYVREDVMGVDYGLVAAVSLIYVLPSLILYLFAQKYLTQMTLGGVKG